MRIAEFLAARGFSQMDLVRAAERTGHKLYPGDLCRMINARIPFYPKVRATLRRALTEQLSCSVEDVAMIEELREPTKRRPESLLSRLAKRSP